MELINTDFPEPVAPATKRWGIRARSEIQGSPEMDFPNAKGSRYFRLRNSLFKRISFKEIMWRWSLGSSIPTTFFPGIGATIRTERALRANERSSAKFTILLTLMPAAG